MILFFFVFIIMNSTLIYNNGSIIFSKVPKEYESYKSVNKIDSLLLNSNFNVKIFESLYDESIVNSQENVASLNDSINYIKVNQLDRLTFSWYKINELGEIIDSLSFYDEDIYNVNSYLVNVKKDYYVTWLKDGDTIKKPIQVLGNGEIIKEEIANTYFENVQFLNTEYIYKPDSDERTVKTVFYKGDTFYTCFTRKSSNYHFKSFKDHNIIEYSSLGEVVYYEKIKWNASLFPNINISSNGSRPDYWDGCAYIDLKMFEETFKIKRYCTANSNYDISEKFRYGVYGSSNKKYYILRMPDEFNKFYLVTQ